MRKHLSAILGRRAACLVLSAVMALSAVWIAPGRAAAQSTETSVDFSQMPESDRNGSWGVEKTVADGVLNIRFSTQYAEQRYDLPEGVEASAVSQITVNTSSGDTGSLCIKLLQGTEQADVAYNTNTIAVAQGLSFDGIGLMSLAETGGEYTIESITFTQDAAPAAAASVQSLKELYSEDFRMGVACEAISHWNNRRSEIGNPDKEALMLEQFNSMTFGNELKPDYNMNYRSPEATETYLPFGANRAAIEMLDWAKENGMPVRGHVLVWHSQCPDAVFCKEYKPVRLESGNLASECLVDAETMKLRMESYIHSAMEYMYANGYGDVIYAWDVVNEAVEPGKVANMRQSYWYRTIGPDFVYLAFKYTREAVEKYSAEYASLYGVDPADPEALKSIQPKLFYNDYNEFQASKRDAIISIVKPIVADGYLDGIGMQGHLSDTTSIDDIITALKMYSEVVDEVHITELDVMQSSSGPNADYYQGVYYNQLFSALLQARREGAKLTSVTIWGLTDDNSWKKESNPLIFAGDLSPKMAYYGIVNAKTGDPMPEPEYVAPDFSDGIITFDDGQSAAELGFAVRGSGTVTVQSEDTCSGEGAIRNSGRASSWNGTSFEVSRFVGQTIYVSAWVKSEDDQVRLTADIDGKWPNIASVKTGGQWTQISGTYTIPSELTGLSLYFETGGTADIYIDDVVVKLVGQNESFEGETNIATPRGVGHMPKLEVTKAESHIGNKSLRVNRSAQEATAQFDIGKYVGRIVDITAYVKTGDAAIRMGIDGLDSRTTVEVPSAEGQWTEVKGTFQIPVEWQSAQLFIETDGTADYYVDDISVRIGSVALDLENGLMPFTTRWDGAGKLKLMKESADSGFVAQLTERTASYYGICYDVTAYLGMEVVVSFDVKTDDATVRLSGDIDGLWPTYLSADAAPGSYTTVSGTIRLPGDLSGLRVYIETDGTSDLYVDNFSITRAPIA